MYMHAIDMEGDGPCDSVHVHICALEVTRPRLPGMSYVHSTSLEDLSLEIKNEEK